MSLASPGSLMFLAAALLWPPATRRWALLPLALAYAWAWAQGGIEPLALAWPALLVMAAVLARPAMAAPARATGHALFLALAMLLFLHWLPGFHNPLVIPRAALTPDAVPFAMYLNLDKPLVAFWVVLAAAPAMAGASARATLTAALAACAGAIVACLGLALVLGVVGWTPKWPDSGWLWLVNNALLVTLAEEALFRGYVQERLTRAWRDRPAAPRPGCWSPRCCSGWRTTPAAGNGCCWPALPALATAWPTATAAWRPPCWPTWA